MAYKRDLPDERESPGLKVAELLLREGADVFYHDPFVPRTCVNTTTVHSRAEAVELVSQTLDKNTIRKADMVIITTDHSSIDYENTVRMAETVLDTRNITGRLGMSSGSVFVL